MVQQNRRVVENYVLYKLEATNFGRSFISTGSENSSKPKASLGSLTIPQKPSLIDVAIRNLATQYEKRYKETFPDLLDELRYGAIVFVLAVAISLSTAIFPWNLFCRDHSHVFI